MRKLIPTLLVLTFLLTPILSKAQDNFRAGHNFDTEFIKIGETNTYIHYRTLKNGKKLPASIKEITVKKDGDDLHILQTEYAPNMSKTLETYVDSKTLLSNKHIRTTGDKRESFMFSDQMVTGIKNDTIAVNSGFEIKLDQPTYNFEIDFIFIQAIDWSEHRSIVMNFYHPGGRTAPADYTFTREKEETLTLASGHEVDTWVVYTDYNGQPPARFWVSKSNNEIIKQETDAMEMAGFKFVKKLIEIE